MSAPSQVPTYQISLDEPPERRWEPVIRDYRQRIKGIYDHLEAQQSGLLSTLISGAISLGSNFNMVLHEAEIQSIAKACDIPFGKLVILQIMYELCACCSSLVFTIGDKPVHVRTMDWALEELKDLTIMVEFTHHNKVIYKAVTWAGYVGVMTAVKPGVASVSLNYREGKGEIMKNLRNLVAGRWPAGYLIRYVMENPFSCASLIEVLKTYQLVAPCYFIVAGTEADQCADIVRDRDGGQLYRMKAKPDGKIIQTNIDLEAGDGASNILMSRERQAKAREVIMAIQEEDQDLGIVDLFARFTVSPIVNEITIYMAIMSPQSGELACRIYTPAEIMALA